MTEKVATTAEPTKPNPADYNRLVAHAKILSIRLINSKYDLKPAALTGGRDDWEYNVGYELLDWHCDNEALQLTGTWEYVATCTRKNRKLLTVMAKYAVAYRLSAICDAEAGRHFMERVGRFAAYPYFRSTFAMLTEQSSIMLHPLPIISEQPRWVTPPAKTEEPEEPGSKKAAAVRVKKVEAAKATPSGGSSAPKSGGEV